MCQPRAVSGTPPHWQHLVEQSTCGFFVVVKGQPKNTFSKKDVFCTDGMVQKGTPREVLTLRVFFRVFSGTHKIPLRTTSVLYWTAKEGPFKGLKNTNDPIGRSIPRPGPPFWNRGMRRGLLKTFYTSLVLLKFQMTAHQRNECTSHRKRRRLSRENGDLVFSF